MKQFHVFVVLLVLLAQFFALGVYGADSTENFGEDLTGDRGGDLSGEPGMDPDAAEEVVGNPSDDQSTKPTEEDEESDADAVLALCEEWPEPEEPETEETDPEDAEPEMRFNNLIWANDDEGIAIPIHTDIRKVDLPHFAYAYSWDSDDEWLIRHAFRYDDFDTSTPGNKELIADIIMPENYTYLGQGEDVVGEFEVPTFSAWIVVYDPDSTEPAPGADLFSFAWEYRDELDALHYPIPLGTSREYLEELQGYMGKTATGQTVTGQYFDWEMEMDASVIDTSRAGTYYPFSRPEQAYLGFTHEGLQSTAVHVLDPDEVDLQAWKMSAYGPYITARWLKGITDPELWVSVDGGEWRLADTLEGEYQGDPMTGEDMCGFNIYYGYPEITSMWFNGDFFLPGSSYEFEVRYENNGRSVNTFMMDLTDGPIQFTYGGEGPRDGKDREGMKDPYGNDGGGTPTDPGDGGGTTPDPESGTKPSSGSGGGGTGRKDQYAIAAGAASPVADDELPPETPDAAVEAVEAVQQLDGSSSAGPSPTEKDPEPDAVGTMPEEDSEAVPTDTAGEPGNQTAQNEPMVPDLNPDPPKPEPASGVAGPVSVAVVGTLGVGGAAVVWKLFGKRLVKPR